MEHIVLRCISDVGIENVTFQVLAKYLGHSRATLYRTYGTCRNFLKQIHEACLELLDDDFRVEPRSRELELDEWWTRVSTTLRTPYGKAFIAMRPFVAVGSGIEALLRHEVCWLRRFQACIDKENVSTPLTPLMTTVWSLLVTASEMEPGAAAEQLLRTYALTLVTSYAPGADVVVAPNVPSFC
jgi:AcrR family transcriptional regulator